MFSGLLSPGHVLILLVVVLFVFGAKRLPELGRSLGSGMREFKESVNPDSESTRPQIPAPNTQQAGVEPEPVSRQAPPTEPADARSH